MEGAHDGLRIVRAAVGNDEQLKVSKLLREYRGHGLPDQVRAVVGRQDDRNDRRRTHLRDFQTCEVIDRALQTLAKLNQRLPGQHLLGQRDVRTTLARIMSAGSGRKTRRELLLASVMTSSASCRIVNSVGLPRFTGPVTPLGVAISRNRASMRSST